MVTQTCGGARVGAAKAKLSRAIRRMRIEAVMRRNNITEYGTNVACNSIADWRNQLDARGAAVGARIVAAFERAVGLQDDGAGVPHAVGIGLAQHLDIVAGRHQPIDQTAVEAGLQPQIGMARAPGASEQPARRVERALERL